MCVPALKESQFPPRECERADVFFALDSSRYPVREASVFNFVRLAGSKIMAPVLDWAVGDSVVLFDSRGFGVAGPSLQCAIASTFG